MYAIFNGLRGDPNRGCLRSMDFVILNRNQNVLINAVQWKLPESLDVARRPDLRCLGSNSGVPNSNGRCSTDFPLCSSKIFPEIINQIQLSRLVGKNSKIKFVSISWRQIWWWEILDLENFRESISHFFKYQIFPDLKSQFEDARNIIIITKKLYTQDSKPRRSNFVFENFQIFFSNRHIQAQGYTLFKRGQASYWKSFFP